MEKSKEPRINLCFNLNDQRQKIVYDFLRSIKREKTSVVTDIILKQILCDEQDPLEDLSQKMDALLEKVTEGNRGITGIAEKINGGYVAANVEVHEEPKALEPETESFDESGDDISDEAFTDMMALMF